MSLQDVVDVQVSTTSVRVSQAGFGIPLILSHSATWVERTRKYKSLDDVGADFASTSSRPRSSRRSRARLRSSSAAALPSRR